MARHLTPKEINRIMARQYNAKVDKAAEKFAPQVYASLVITLMKHYSWSFEEIKELIEFNEEVWNDCARRKVKMIDECSKVWGVDLIELIGGGNADGDGTDYRRFTEG